MFKYDYRRADSVEDVCRFRQELKEKGRIIAGGTDLMVQIKEQSSKWKEVPCILDITSLEKELRYVSEEGDTIRIGALSTHTDLEESKVIQKYLPFLGVACSTVGSPQIRNRGTIGGSICNASPAADPLTPLIAAEVEVEIAGLQGVRRKSLKEFYVGKGAIDLGEDEFLTAFLVKKPKEGSKMAFEKLGRRKALAISRLNASVLLHMDAEGCIDEAAVAPGCIFVCPDRVAKAEEILIGQKPSEELFEKAGAAVSEEMIARTGIRWSTEYKQPAVESIVCDALCQAAGIERQ